MCNQEANVMCSTRARIVACCGAVRMFMGNRARIMQVKFVEQHSLSDLVKPFSVDL